MSEGRTTWRDIAGDLREEIKRGDYSPGARLPSRAQLMERYGVASQTVINALNALRQEGLILSITGSGYYVRKQQPVMRMARTRLARAERQAGRGAFTTDAHTSGWTPRVEVDVRIEQARDDVAAALGIDVGTDVLVRDRVMYADEQAVQLATSYLPRDLTRGTAMEAENTGPGGIYARLEEAGVQLVRFDEYVRIGAATEHEADLFATSRGAPVFRIVRTAHAVDRVVEVNFMALAGDRYELSYSLPAE
jgi:GntR family transcriptional regulator